MHPKRKQRLTLAIFIIFFASLGVFLLLKLIDSSKNAFYSPSQFVEANISNGTVVRVGGCVVYDSIKYASHSEQDPKQSLAMNFEMTDGDATVSVSFNKIPPDLFAEGEAAVAIGVVQDGKVIAKEVLAKHDEKYMPAEVSQSLKNKDIEMQSCQAVFKR